MGPKCNKEFPVIAETAIGWGYHLAMFKMVTLQLTYKDPILTYGNWSRGININVCVWIK